MPLTEREKQILQEIERNLDADQPVSAGARQRSPRAEQVRRIRWGAAIFVLGLAVLVAFFITENPLVGIVAFGCMVAAVVLIAAAISRLASDGLDRLQPKERTVGAFRRWERSLRERYRHR